MTEAIMAHPDLRHPFDSKMINPGAGATVLYLGKTIQIERCLDEDDLWITPQDLTRVNGFELKSEGLCYQDLCIPIAEDTQLLKVVDGQQWFNVKAFADWLEQANMVDSETKTWCFGDIPAVREGMMANAMAPDFDITDRQGEVVRMSDYKGKKALIITWSSW
ncbi:MAG: hypothetical protein ACI9CE_000758 [Flavobacterium sp.]|jgi:hypothetical protein